MRLASGKASWCGSKCGIRAFLGLRHEAYRKFAGSYDHHGFKSVRCVKGDKIQVDRIAPGWWPQPQIQHAGLRQEHNNSHSAKSGKKKSVDKDWVYGRDLEVRCRPRASGRSS